MDLTLHDLAIRLDDFQLEADLRFPSGELISLLGPSGCGKTTLLKVIAGLYYPDRGTLRLGEREITRLDPRFRKIGMVFQDYALFPHMSVEKNICYGMEERGEAARERAEELLEMVHMSGYAQRKPEELSGGEKQRVALARALAASPEILLLDEPLSALDAQLRRSLRRQIREVQKQTGLTAVYVTHDQEEAMAISDRIVLMEGGRISQIGSPAELYAQPGNAFAGGFIGTANMIPVRSVRPAGEGRVKLNTEAGELLLNPAALKRPCLLPEGGGSFLHFHPEDCRLEQTAPPPGLSGEARILYQEYGGDFLYLELGWDKGIVRLKAPPGGSYREGDRLYWSVRPEDCLILS